MISDVLVGQVARVHADRRSSPSRAFDKEVAHDDAKPTVTPPRICLSFSNQATTSTRRWIDLNTISTGQGETRWKAALRRKAVRTGHTQSECGRHCSKPSLLSANELPVLFKPPPFPLSFLSTQRCVHRATSTPTSTLYHHFLFAFIDLSLLSSLLPISLLLDLCFSLLQVSSF